MANIYQTGAQPVASPTALAYQQQPPQPSYSGQPAVGSTAPVIYQQHPPPTYPPAPAAPYMQRRATYFKARAIYGLVGMFVALIVVAGILFVFIFYLKSPGRAPCPTGQVSCRKPVKPNCHGACSFYNACCNTQG